ncbi:helix-turn-helix domain-containing protein [Spirosoma sp. KNUC1025]|uniref:helix-turn-helix transcriptional regulator n=1 Tax=Spirosoma sp. KNUC1025 TaxID=2894082 RepID=UPI00386B5492|nr:helix-turn-helix domain-containing protein [Spirosoma sp. KNUC1025]
MMDNKLSVGRPTVYREPLNEVVYYLALLGLTDKEIAETLNISKATLNTWKKQHPEFLDSVTQGKTLADAHVAAAFYKRATGYDYPSEKIFVHEGKEIRVQTTTHIPPDAGAALNWLKNRQPDKWRDKVDVGLPPEIVLTMNLEGESNSANGSTQE